MGPNFPDLINKVRQTTEQKDQQHKREWECPETLILQSEAPPSLPPSLEFSVSLSNGNTVPGELDEAQPGGTAMGRPAIPVISA